MCDEISIESLSKFRRLLATIRASKTPICIISMDLRLICVSDVSMSFEEGARISKLKNVKYKENSLLHRNLDFVVPGHNGQ